eukprot:6474410-Amphidinium_carterae.1
MPANQSAAARSAKHRLQADRLELKECMERVVKTLKQESNWCCCPVLERQYIREGRMKGDLQDVPAAPATTQLALPAPEAQAALTEDPGAGSGSTSKGGAPAKTLSALSTTPWQKNITSMSLAPVWAMKMAPGQIQPAICSVGNFRMLGRALHRELTLEIVEFFCQISADFTLAKSLRNDKAFVDWLIERGQTCGGSERAIVLRTDMAWQKQGVYVIEHVDGELVATHRFANVSATIPWSVGDLGPLPTEVTINYSDARACIISEDGRATRTLSQFVKTVSQSDLHTPPPKRCRTTPRHALALENGQPSVGNGSSMGGADSSSRATGSTETPSSATAGEASSRDEDRLELPAALAETGNDAETHAEDVARSIEAVHEHLAVGPAAAQLQHDIDEEDAFEPRDRLGDHLCIAVATLCNYALRYWVGSSENQASACWCSSLLVAFATSSRHAKRLSAFGHFDITRMQSLALSSRVVKCTTPELSFMAMKVAPVPSSHVFFRRKQGSQRHSTSADLHPHAYTRKTPVALRQQCALAIA